MFLSQSSLFSENSQNVKEKNVNKLIIGHAEIFDVLERPQVVFDHGLHGKKLKKEGCRTCHPPDADGALIFKYPFAVAVENRNTVKDAYHEKCISCHMKLIEEGRKYGPITCGECHDKKRASLKVTYPFFDFNFARHEQHVKRLKRKCDHCHHIYDKEDKELVYEQGTEQSCHYCHDMNTKRGPLLAAEIDVTKRKHLTMQRVCHNLCVNCHLFYSQQDSKAGPLECSKCHTGKYMIVAQLAHVSRPDRDQPKKSHISIEDAKMKGVFFNHEYHEKNTKTCRDCHHETLMACKECHNLAGKEEGGRITIAGAYHDLSALYSCVGCHNDKKTGKNCSGCHHHLLDMDVRSGEPKKDFCSVCHSGKKEILPRAQSIPIASVNTDKVPEKVTIKVLEKEYEPSVFPHRKILKKLLEISNKNKMATCFHRDIQTICEGCHHQSSAKAEAQKDKPPYCRNCHSFFFDAKNMNKPRLLAAYHRQCLGCHEKMEIKQQGCIDCHKEKAIRPKDIL